MKPNRKFRKLDLLLSLGTEVERHQPKRTVHWLHGAVSCARQEITRTLWKPEVHYNAHNSLPLVPFLSQINPFHALPSYFFIVYCNTVLPPTDICAKLSPNSIKNCSSAHVHLYTELGPLYWAILSTCQLQYLHKRQQSPVPLAQKATSVIITWSVPVQSQTAALSH
jgi:hypothetical protein